MGVIVTRAVAAGSHTPKMVDRICGDTPEIQDHIISRAMLRLLGGCL